MMGSSTILAFEEVHIADATLVELTDVLLGILSDLKQPISLAAFRDSTLSDMLIGAATDVLSNYAAEVTQCLNDRQLSSVAVVVKDSRGIMPPPQLTFVRTVILLALARQSDTHLASDERNGTPFSVYAASDANRAAMDSAGLRSLRPSDVLGFHSDGAFQGANVYIPAVVGLQNIVLNYGSPGNFLWVPFALWDEGRELLEEFKDFIAGMSTTPIAHRDMGGNVVVDKEATIETKIIWSDADDFPVVFLNGEPLPGTVEIFEKLQSSIAGSPRLQSKQDVSRLTIIRNDRGVHARDILADPLAQGAKPSRILLRTIAASGTAVPGVVRLRQ